MCNKQTNASDVFHFLVGSDLFGRTNLNYKLISKKAGIILWMQVYEADEWWCMEYFNIVDCSQKYDNFRSQPRKSAAFGRVFPSAMHVHDFFRWILSNIHYLLKNFLFSPEKEPFLRYGAKKYLRCDKTFCRKSCYRQKNGIRISTGPLDFWLMIYKGIKISCFGWHRIGQVDHKKFLEADMLGKRRTRIWTPSFLPQFSIHLSSA